MGAVFSVENMKNALMVSVGIVIYYSFVKKVTDSILPA